MTIEQVHVPDVGEADDVEVVEILVAVGDVVELDASLVVLESDKASMEIPSPCAGTVTAINVSEGDKVEEGSLLVEIELSGAPSVAAEDTKPPVADEEIADEEIAEELPAEDPPGDTDSEPAAPPAAKIETSKVITVPDVGDAAEVVVVEVLVHQGDSVADGDSLVVLESDKASMEIPADFAGIVQEIFVTEGDEVQEGDPLATVVGMLEPEAQAEPAAAPAKAPPAPAAADTAGSVPPKPAARSEPSPAPASHGQAPSQPVSTGKVHAGPAVRKEAREYGVRLEEVTGTGRKGRILKEDVQAFVRQTLSSPQAASGAGGIPEIPAVDFTKWGEIEQMPLSRIRKASARNLHRSWLNIPHVTQFDEADITDLEGFRKSQNQALATEGVKLTPLAFLIRAVVGTLQTYPRFNASIASDYDHLVIKKYFNIGIAVETDDGLVVPVLKDADKKGVVQLARESAELAAQARDKKLPMDAMQGATFTISSLGGIGGTAFTPIVNAPEVAILGVSRSKVEPQYDGEQFVPRTMLPLSLSYDHRAIDGAEAARFTTHLARVLGDIRHLVL